MSAKLALQGVKVLHIAMLGTSLIYDMLSLTYICTLSSAFCGSTWQGWPGSCSMLGCLCSPEPASAAHHIAAVLRFNNDAAGRTWSSVLPLGINRGPGAE